MGSKTNRRLFLSGALSAVGSAAFGQAMSNSIVPVLRPGRLTVTTTGSPQAILSEIGLSGKTTFAVANARTGEVVESHSPLVTLPSASVVKALTAQYALEKLGPGYRFTTRILANGPIRNGILDGDLALVGGGDPVMDTDGLAVLAKRLAEAGVKTITGRFYVLTGVIPTIERIDADQPDYLGYNPAISGLNLNYNRVHFEWRNAGGELNITMQARDNLHRPDVNMTKLVLDERDSPIYAFSKATGTETWSVAKHALKRDGARWLPVRQPALYVGEVFQSLARAYGTELPHGKSRFGNFAGTELCGVQSVPLDEILKGMLFNSTNLTAEAVGLVATKNAGGKVTSLRSSARSMEQWAERRLGLGHSVLHDHSGLNDETRISAGGMVRALVGIGARSKLAELMKPMKLRDSKGNLNTSGTANVVAKTGTLNFVSALAGYIQRDGSDPLAFAIFSADLEQRGRVAKQQAENPRGAKSWANRARRQQWALIDRWVRLDA